MYTRKIVYKVFAIAMLILNILSGINLIVISITALVQSSEILKTIKNFTDSIATVSSSFEGLYSFIEMFIYALLVCMIIIAIVGGFMQYVESSSMLNFTTMIEYETDGSVTPLTKSKYVFSPNVYRKYGMILFAISLAVGFVGSVAMIIYESISSGCFIALPIIPIAVFGVILLFTYVHYYVRYKILGDLQELLSLKKPEDRMLERLKENNSNILRTYCIVLFAIAVIYIILAIVLLFAVYSYLSTFIGITYANILAAVIIISSIINVAKICVMGCYVDNIAKMLEHYQIKYKI